MRVSTRRQEVRRTSIAFVGTLVIIGLATACSSGKKSPTQSTTTVTSTQTVQSETPPGTGTGASSESAGSVQYLEDLEPLSSSNGVDTGSEEVSGQNYDRSVSLRIDKSSIPENDAEYNLGRHWRTMQVVIGLRDDSPTGCRAQFEVFADGKSINSTTLGLGRSQNLNFDVSNVLRLKIEVTYAAATDVSSYCYAVWGDAHMKG